MITVWAYNRRKCKRSSKTSKKVNAKECDRDYRGKIHTANVLIFVVVVVVVVEI